LPSVSLDCIQTISKYYDWNEFDMVIEPSIGNGSFYKQLPTIHKIGIDISPDFTDENVIQCDFLSYILPKKYYKILVVGNPPFGKVSSLAIKFFNHAASFCDVIAFIIPKTFRRNSVQNRLDPSFHLLFDKDIPDKPCSFTPAMNVKCCFQIWEKRVEKREKIYLETTHQDWTFLPYGEKDASGQPTPPVGADFAIRAYGGKCGYIIKKDLHELRPKSWHWIKSNIDVNLLISRFESLDYSNSKNTARQNSMGRGELVSLYNDFIHTELE
jgi:hypothetical protein